MAVVLRCFCVLPRPNSSGFPRRIGHFPDETHASGKLASLPVYVRKFISSLDDANWTLKTHGALLGTRAMQVEQDYSHFFWIPETCDVAQMGLDHETASGHQVRWASASGTVVAKPCR